MLYGCLTAFFFLIGFAIISIFSSIFRFIFGLRQGMKQFADFGSATTGTSSRTHQNSSRTTGNPFFTGQTSGEQDFSGTEHAHRNPKNGKFFASDEGEYVDFEEVK